MGTTTTSLPVGAPSTPSGAYGDVRGASGLHVTYATVTMSNSYATGGETLSMPSGMPGDFVAVVLLKDHDGTRKWTWDGSQSTPKLIAYDAFATQEGNTTDVSAVTLPALFISQV